MLYLSKILLTITVMAGAATVPTISQAQSSKSEGASAAKKTQASNDEFEENRRAHMSKSKENNTKKSEN